MPPDKRGAKERAARAIVLAVGTAFAVGCPPQEDVTPQIHVAPGAAARAGWIGKTHVAAGQGGPASKSTPTSAPKPAMVKTLARGEELGGPNAVGRPGDLLLANDEVAFVIDRLGRGAGFAESGGNLVDAADARARKDELGQMFTYFGTFPRQAVYEKLSSGTENDGSAWVLAEGHELYDASIVVKTRYHLAAGDRALLLETTLENRGASDVKLAGLGDAIQWGGAEKIAPGYPVGFKGPFQAPYVGGVGRVVSYGITSTDGTIEGTSGGSWTDTLVKKDVTLAPGKNVQYARVFVVGARPDTSSIVAELAGASGGAVGRLRIVLHEVGAGANATTRVPAGGRVRLYLGGKPALTLATSESDVALLGDVPPGAYDVEYADGGGRRGASRAHVVVKGGEEATARVEVTRAGHVHFACTEARDGALATPTSCKAIFEGLSGTADPDFGPSHAAGPARNVVTTADGVVDVWLAPGRYRVSLSRGPEYALSQWEQEVREQEAKEQDAKGEAPIAAPPLVRVVDTRGYLATDFHQHTMLGADAPVGTRDRVIANAAEGVEVAVATEHNVIADLEPMVRELGLARTLVELPGDELTTDTSKRPWGHANAFPLHYDASAPRGGAVAVRDRTAHEVFEELRRSPDPFVLQINHPRSGLTGYFDQLHFDAQKGAGTEPGYDGSFDALEVWNGRNVDARDKVLEDFLALLRTKHPVTATADTDTHGVVGQEAGYPRSYVRVDDDGPTDPWPPSRTIDLVRGVRERRDVVMTNGPFLRVAVRSPQQGAASDVGIGGVARGHDLVLHVRIECAPWVDVDELRVVRVDTRASNVVLPVTLRDEAVRDAKKRVAELDVRIHAASDDAFYVAVSGKKPLRPVLSGDDREITAFAATSAIWIDADGDGVALGRKATDAVARDDAGRRGR